MQNLKTEVEVADEAQRQLRHHDYNLTAQVGAQHIPLTLFWVPLLHPIAMLFSSTKAIVHNLSYDFKMNRLSE